MKNAYESKSTLWVKMGTQNRLAHIKEDDDDLVLESLGSEEKGITDVPSEGFDPIKARKMRAKQIAKGVSMNSSNS